MRPAARIERRGDASAERSETHAATDGGTSGAGDVDRGESDGEINVATNGETDPRAALLSSIELEADEEDDDDADSA